MIIEKLEEGKLFAILTEQEGAILRAMCGGSPDFDKQRLLYALSTETYAALRGLTLDQCQDMVGQIHDQLFAIRRGVE